jgi:hypothetical protein
LEVGDAIAALTAAITNSLKYQWMNNPDRMMHAAHGMPKPF